MKSTEIEVGKTYRNRYAGTTTRKVQCICAECIPTHWHGKGPRPDDVGVQYVTDKGQSGRLYRSYFAHWAGSEVAKNEETPIQKKESSEPF
jgi:hypothetical protein